MSAQKQCTAYTKDHVECGIHIHSSHHTYCKIHRNYARNWFAVHPPLYGIFNPEMVEKSRVIKEYIAQFSSGAIVPSRFYVYKLQCNPAYYFYYILLCGHSPTVNPLWNKRLFRDVVDFYFARAIRNKERIRELLFICNVLGKNTDCLFYLYSTLIEITFKYVLEHYYNDVIIETQIQNILGSIFEMDCWRTVALSDEMHYIIGEHADIIHTHYKAGSINTDEYNYLDKVLRHLIEVEYKSWKEYMIGSLKSRIQPYIEELHAAAWHPRRVSTWIDAYGLEDVFDMM